jgi:L-threonylcarbamoyladenylate synthase
MEGKKIDFFCRHGHLESACIFCNPPRFFTSGPIPLKPHVNLLQEAIGIIRDGGLVIAPTDNYYGIIGDAWSQKAVKRLVQIKGRNYGHPIPLIAGNMRIVRSAAHDIPPILSDLAREFWPGPLTLVLHGAKGFPCGITGGTDSIGIRIPDQCPALDLAKFFRRPLTATTASFNGQPGPRSVMELDNELVKEVDLVINGGWTRGFGPSTVLNLVQDTPTMLRSGTLGERVDSFLAELSWRMEIGGLPA